MANRLRIVPTYLDYPFAFWQKLSKIFHIPRNIFGNLPKWQKKKRPRHSPNFKRQKYFPEQHHDEINTYEKDNIIFHSFAHRSKHAKNLSFTITMFTVPVHVVQAMVLDTEHTKHSFPLVQNIHVESSYEGGFAAKKCKVDKQSNV